MNDYPIVSIVIPVYNVESLLRRCVNSVLAQTYRNIQVILVDDGSTDSSGKLCDSFAKQDERIETIHTLNGGLSAARNTGMRLVKGEWVAFVDSDDMVGRNHIANLMSAVAPFEGEIAVAVTGSTQISYREPNIMNPDCHSIGYINMDSAEAIAISVTEGELFASHAWGKLYPRKLFSLLEYPVGKYYEDQFVTYKVFLEADCIAYEDANDYGYTVDRGGSISNSSYLHRLDYLEAIRNMRDDLKKKLPKVNEAVSLRYYTTLASSAAIATLSTNPSDFERLYAELVEARRNALSMKDLTVKSRAVYFLSYLGSGATRRLLTTVSERIHAK